jgi:hypothetical protein
MMLSTNVWGGGVKREKWEMGRGEPKKIREITTIC